MQQQEKELTKDIFIKNLNSNKNDKEQFSTNQLDDLINHLEFDEIKNIIHNNCTNATAVSNDFNKKNFIKRCMILNPYFLDKFLKNPNNYIDLKENISSFEDELKTQEIKLSNLILNTNNVSFVNQVYRFIDHKKLTLDFDNFKGMYGLSIYNLEFLSSKCHKKDYELIVKNNDKDFALKYIKRNNHSFGHKLNSYDLERVLNVFKKFGFNMLCLSELTKNDIDLSTHQSYIDCINVLSRFNIVFFDKELALFEEYIHELKNIEKNIDHNLLDKIVLLIKKFRGSIALFGISIPWLGLGVITGTTIGIIIGSVITGIGIGIGIAYYFKSHTVKQKCKLYKNKFLKWINKFQ